ncbi:hypothetical protein Tco_0008061 [Tanacetum coccineum]
MIGVVLTLALTLLGTNFSSLEGLKGLILNIPGAITFFDSCGVGTEFEVTGFDKLSSLTPFEDPLFDEVGIGSCSGPRCQDTILGDVNAQTRFEITSKQSIDPPLSRGYTLGSGEDSMKLIGIDGILLKLVLPVFVSAVKHMLMLPVQVSAVEVNPVIYTSCIEQFWATAKVQTVNVLHQLQALVDKKRVIVTESSIRRDLHLDDAEDGGVKFLMYPRFLQVFINQQLGNMSTHKKIFVNPFHTKKVFANMKRAGKDFSGRITPLFDTMMVQVTEEVLDLEKAKDAQAKEIAALKKMIQSIADIDADNDVTLVNETQERYDDDLMFDTGVLDDDEMPVEAKVDGKDEAVTTASVDDSTAGEAVTTASVDDSVVPTTIEEITLALTLIQIKAAKPKVVTTAATTTTTTRPKARGVVLDAELIEEQKLARKQEEEANIALIESWENTQAMMEADRLLAERLQSKEREELTDEEKGKLFMELMEKRRKHFAALRAQEKRNRPPTKAQKRTQMSTYLKHMGGYTYKQLKGKSFDEIQKLFDKEMKRVNTFVAMGSEVQESNEKKVEGSEETAKGSRKKMLGRKRAGKEQQQESSKKQRMEEDKESDEVEEVEEDDEAELKKHLVIKKDEDIAIDAIPLATKPPVIIDYKLHKEGMMVHYQLIRADGSSKRYSSMIRMLQGIDREDLEALWKLVKTKHGDIRPEDEFERVL